MDWCLHRETFCLNQTLCRLCRDMDRDTETLAPRSNHKRCHYNIPFALSYFGSLLELTKFIIKHYFIIKQIVAMAQNYIFLHLQ